MTPAPVSPPEADSASVVSLSVKIRSALFRALFPAWTMLVCTSCLPGLWLARDSRGVAFSGKIWSAGIVFLLRTLCGLRFRTEGTEHLSAEGGPALIACRHESVWETCIFLHLLDHPAYVLKKELLSVPLFGRFLKGLEMVAVDRSGGGSAVRAMQQACVARLQEGRSVVIFPEGTRMRHGELDSPFQPGVAFLYASLPENVKLIPAALNSGKYWSPFSRYIFPGVITLRFLPPLPSGLARKPLMETLENEVRAASRDLTSF